MVCSSAYFTVSHSKYYFSTFKKKSGKNEYYGAIDAGWGEWMLGMTKSVLLAFSFNVLLIDNRILSRLNRFISSWVQVTLNLSFAHITYKDSIDLLLQYLLYTHSHHQLYHPLCHQHYSLQARQRHRHRDEKRLGERYREPEACLCSPIILTDQTRLFLEEREKRRMTLKNKSPYFLFRPQILYFLINALKHL